MLLILHYLIFLNVHTITVNIKMDNINRKIVMIEGYECTTNTTIEIKNCMFKHNGDLNTQVDYPLYALISIELPKFNLTIILINCEFFRNAMKLLSAEVLEAFHNSLLSASCDLASKVVIINCTLFANERALLHISVSGLLKCTNVYIIGPINIMRNKLVRSSSNLINFDHVIAHVSGPIHVYKNSVISVLSTYQSHVMLNGVINMTKNKVRIAMQFQESYVTFNGTLHISENEGSVIIAIPTQSSNVTFNSLVPLRFYGIRNANILCWYNILTLCLARLFYLHITCVTKLLL